MSRELKEATEQLAREADASGAARMSPEEVEAEISAAQERRRVRRRVVVACFDADGASTLWPATFSWLEGLVEEEIQWDYIRKTVEDHGYQGPFIFFDETEWAFRRCFDTAFEWDSPEVPAYQIPAHKTRTFRLTAVEWDLDDGLSRDESDLEAELNEKWLNTTWLVPAPGFDPEDYIANQLSDRSGWCTLGITIEEVMDEG